LPLIYTGMLQSDDQFGDSSFELEVLHELSHARTKPREVADAIRSRLPHFKGNDYYPPDRGGKTAVVSKEGQVAVRDAISYLERSPQLPQLAEACTQGLRLAAEDHLLDLGTRGAVGHQGADSSASSDRMNRYGTWSGKCGECLWFGRMGTSAKQIVEDLIIDDGVASRGHRLGIYDPAFCVAGVRMGTHKTFGACCVIEFANEYADDEDCLIRRVTAGPPVVAAGRDPVKTQWNLGQCPGCKETIHGGAVMEALGHKWHRDCFACQAEGCGQSLRGVPYQEHGGIPFCKACYYTQFGSTCNGCGEKIHGGVLKAMGQSWHKECFTCGSCRGPLEAKYETRDDKPLCNACCAVPGRAAPSPAATRKTVPSSRSAGGVAPKAPMARAGAGARSSPAAKSSALPKIGAGRATVMKAAPPKVSMGSAKRAVESLSMNYSDLC